MGPGALNQLADEVRALKANKVLIVTDQGLIDAGLVEQVQAVLEKSDIKYAVFGEVEADPRYEIVSDCVEMIHREKADFIIGFGGGSPIDIAKVSAIMATNEGLITEYFGIDLVPKSGLPTIIIPTTAGTGSEVTPIAILSEFHIPHGVANSIMLASVMEFNKLGNLERFGEIAGYLGENTSGLSVRLAAHAAVEAMRTLAADLKIPDHLSDFGIQDKDIPELAAGVMKVTRLLANNPRELSQKDAEAIYRSVL